MSGIAERFASAWKFDAYLETVEKNRDLWFAIAKRVRIDEETIAAFDAIPGRWHLLALTEDWCGDAVNTLPVVAHLAEAVPALDMRLLSRDENPDLMDAHLTNGTSRSIPVVIVYDDKFQERAWWGPRPGPIQEWVMTEGMQLESSARYKEVRRFYARDKGRSVLQELRELLEGASAGD